MKGKITVRHTTPTQLFSFWTPPTPKPYFMYHNQLPPPPHNYTKDLGYPMFPTLFIQ